MLVPPFPAPSLSLSLALARDVSESPRDALPPRRAEDLCVELAPRFFILPLGPGRDKFEQTAKKLRQAHHRHYLVWNLADQQFKFSDGKPFDPRQFDDQV